MILSPTAPHRVLEKPVAVFTGGHVVQGEVSLAQKVVSVRAKRDAISQDVPADGAKAGVQQILQDYVFCVLRPHGACTQLRQRHRNPHATSIAERMPQK